MPTLAEHIKYLQENWDPDIYVCGVFWQGDDVKAKAESMDVVLEEDEIKQVLDSLSDNHDAEYGINWASITYAIEQVVEGRK